MSEILEIEEFRNLAQAALAQIEAAFADHDSTSAIIALDQSRMRQYTRNGSLEQQTIGSAKERLIWERRRLHAALERMRHGQFGICCYCEDSIPVERLRADVATPFCSPCQYGIDARATII
ncbi:DnaK suppressor protein [Nitrosovibrio sp. Nv6]|nr:DnaK suppressor protein [Nitrosovibrio sp. Nv6]